MTVHGRSSTVGGSTSWSTRLKARATGTDTWAARTTSRM